MVAALLSYKALSSFKALNFRFVLPNLSLLFFSIFVADENVTLQEQIAHFSSVI